MNPQELKTYTDIAKPLIDVAVSTFIKPQLDRINSWFKKQGLESQVSNSVLFESRFQEYLNRTYQKCRSTNTLIFPNQQIDLLSIYLPLTVRCTKNNQEILVDDFTDELLNPYNKILISDSAGMGKSTLVKFLAVKIIENVKGIPIVIDLRNLSVANTILEEIYQQLNPIDKMIEKELILKFIESGSFIFLLDGFDEIEQTVASTVIKDLRLFLDKTGSSKYVMTSRPELSLYSFGDFQRFLIVPLQYEEAKKLIIKYDTISNYGISQRLLSDIETNYRLVSSFLENPFLTSLLYKAYSYNKDIPANKITFYEEVYTALYKGHDLSKNGFRRAKESGLDMQAFRVILRELAFDSIKANVVSYEKQDLLLRLENAKQKCVGIDFKPISFFNDLLSTVPLFIEDGTKVKWAHKSFMDFFTAEYLVYDKDKEIKLEQIYQQKIIKYLTVLDFFYEMDYKIFRNVIIRQLLKDFSLLTKTHSYDTTEIPVDLINDRIACLFANEIVLFFHSEFSIGKHGIGHVMVMAAEKKLIPEKSILPSAFHTPNGVGVTYKKNLFISEIMSFLFKKRENLFNPSTNHDLSYFQEIEQKIFNETIRIDDTKGTWYNSLNYFKVINNILAFTDIQGQFFLSFDKALKVLDQINSEIDEQKKIVFDV